MQLQLPDGRRIDLVRHRVVGPDGVEPLTQLECDALRFLARTPGVPVERQALEREVWGFRAGTRSEAVPVAMRRLRRKVGDALATMRGVGWRLDATADAFPAPTSMLRRPRLPQATSPWVPRPELVQRLRDLLASGARMVAVVGPPGIGCSRLVHEALRADDPVYVALDDTELSAARLQESVASALQLSRTEPSAIADALEASDERLLVLDGAAALAPEAVATLAVIRAAATVVCTLHEAVVDPSFAVLPVGPLVPVEAADFLRRRAAPTPLADDVVAAVLRVAGGLPAALELAAAQAWLGDVVLMETLDLTPLDGLVARSWGALSAEARDALRVCAAMGGPIRPTSLPKLLGSLAPLAELRRHSLVQMTAGGEVDVLPTVRRFCAQQADPRGVVAPALEQVVTWAEDALRSEVREPGPATDRLRALHRALMETARRGPVELRVRAGLAASRSLRLWGDVGTRLSLVEELVASGLATDEQAVELRRQLGWARRAAGASEQACLDAVVADDSAHAERLRAVLAERAGRFDDARQRFERVAALTDPSEPQHVLAVLQRLSLADFTERRDRVARQAAFGHAEALCRAHDLRTTYMEVLRTRALDAWNAGEREAAIAWTTEALQRAEADGQAMLFPELWNQLGMTLVGTDLSGARQAFERSLLTSRQIGMGGSSDGGRANLGLVQYADGLPERALETVAPNVQSPEGSGAVWQLSLLVACAAHRWLGQDAEAAMARGRLDPLLLGRIYSKRGADHGHALLGLVDIAGDLARPTPEGAGRIESAIERARDFADEPSASALRFLLAHAERVRA